LGAGVGLVGRRRVVLAGVLAELVGAGAPAAVFRRILEFATTARSDVRHDVSSSSTNGCTSPIVNEGRHGDATPQRHCPGGATYGGRPTALLRRAQPENPLFS